MDQIVFFSEEIDFSLTNETTLVKWIHHTITEEGCELNNLNYIFCSDEYLFQVNVEHLDHNYYTDIITFDNSDTEHEIEGDIFVSIDRVKDNATTQKVSFEHELRRVLIHGALHLLGYNDKTDDEKTLMREKENAYLSLPKFQ